MGQASGGQGKGGSVSQVAGTLNPMYSNNNSSPPPTISQAPQTQGISQNQMNGKGQSQLMAAQPPGQAQNTVTSGQPIMGQPNQYMNTIGQNQQPFSYAQHGNGKGKG